MNKTLKYKETNPVSKTNNNEKCSAHSEKIEETLRVLPIHKPEFQQYTFSIPYNPQGAHRCDTLHRQIHFALAGFKEYIGSDILLASIQYPDENNSEMGDNIIFNLFIDTIACERGMINITSRLVPIITMANLDGAFTITIENVIKNNDVKE